MSLWSKVITALRGSANEAAEAIADTHALKILDQEVRDASQELNISKENLTEKMARQKVAEQKCATLKSKIAEFEDFAIQALEKNDEPLAMELAEKVAELEKQLNTEQNACDDYTHNAHKLRHAIKQAEQNIKQLKQQVETVKATDNVQRAQAAVAQRHTNSDSSLSAAMDTLERIKEKQELKAARFNAAQELADELSDDTLNTRLETAGIVANNLNGDEVLARLKHKAILRIESDK